MIALQVLMGIFIFLFFGKVIDSKSDSKDKQIYGAIGIVLVTIFLYSLT